MDNSAQAVEVSTALAPIKFGVFQYESVSPWKALRDQASWPGYVYFVVAARCIQTKKHRSMSRIVYIGQTGGKKSSLEEGFRGFISFGWFIKHAVDALENSTSFGGGLAFHMINCHCGWDPNGLESAFIQGFWELHEQDLPSWQGNHPKKGLANLAKQGIKMEDVREVLRRLEL